MWSRLTRCPLLEGELSDLVEDFSDGRIQFAFVKVKDPNTGLPKFALIAWCGGGVPERTKGYFTTHTAAVSKVLHGYHVQITARSDADLEPETIVKKIADASGAKYSAGSSATSSAAASTASPKPPVASKPVFTPTASSAVNPIVAARNRRGVNTDDDGWGEDAPPVTRTELEKVEPAYKPTKVDMAQLTGQRPEPSRFTPTKKEEEDRSDVVKGGYQPVGKVDIAAIRAAAKSQQDDRPTPVKGAYEPVGKVDIAAIRAKAQKPPPEPQPSSEEQEDRPRSLAERSAAFSQPQSERLTSLPKPKVARKFDNSTFTGTKAPTPGGLGFGSPAAPTPPPVGAASRTFADQGGKTPAQLWAEKKAREGGTVPAPSPAALGIQKSGSSVTTPLGVQKSGEWKSSYTGKSWAPVQTAGYDRGAAGRLSQDNTGDTAERSEQPSEPSSSVSALRDRFKDAPPIGVGAPHPAPQAARDEPQEQPEEPTPPPPPSDTRPSGGFALPGLPARPPPPTDEEEEEPEPTPPPVPAERPAAPRQDAYEEEEPEHSPVRVAVPVARSPEPELERPEERQPPPIPAQEIERGLPKEEDLPQESYDMGRGAATAVAEQEFGHDQVAASQAQPGGQAGGKRAMIQYDYDKAEDNEIDLREGEYVTNIDMVDEDWWMGTNSRGESGLFPSNYVELVADDPTPAPSAAPAASPAPAAAPPQSAPAPAAASQGRTATALYDYEAAEDNGKSYSLLDHTRTSVDLTDVPCNLELSFNENDKITNIEFPDEDWWFGHLGNKQGLFPANYVELDK